MLLRPSTRASAVSFHRVVALLVTWILGLAGAADATQLPVRFDFKVVPIVSATPAVIGMGSVTPRNTATVNASVHTNGTGIVTQLTGIAVPGLSGPLNLSPCSGASTCISASVTMPATGHWTRTAGFGAGFGMIVLPGEIRAHFSTTGPGVGLDLLLPLSQAVNSGFAATTAPLPTMTSLGGMLSGSAFVQGSAWVDTTALNFTFPSSATVSAVGGISTPGGAPTSQWRIGNTLNAVTPTFIVASRFDPNFVALGSNASVAFFGLSMTVVPEPSTGLLAGLGFVGVALWDRRGRRQGNR